PTTYRGSAVIDGVRHEAEVRLDAARMCLVIAATAVLSWPSSGADVDGTTGGYHIRFDGDEFSIAPSVPDGFGDALHLRRRLGDLPSNGTSATRPPVVAEAPVAGPSTRPERPGFRAKAHARARVQTARSAGVLTGRDLGVRTAIVILSVLALVVVTVAFATGALEFPPSRVVVAGSPGGPPESEPGPSEVSPTVAGVTGTTDRKSGG